MVTSRGWSSLAVMVAAASAGIGVSAAQAAVVPGTSTEPHAWFKADAITGVADGESLRTWTDSSANGRHAEQALNFNRQPHYRANGIAPGIPSVRFNTNVDAGTAYVTNEYMYFGSAPLANSETADLTMFVVALKTGGTTARGTILNTRQGATAATNNGFIFGFGADADTANYAQVGKAMDGGGGIQSTSMSGEGPKLLSLSRDGLATTLASYGDDSADSHSATWEGFLPSGQANTQIGTEAGNNYFYGDIAEIVIYDAALSADEYAAVTSYLGEKYGIATAIPEPTAVVGLIGMGGLLMMRRRGQ